MRPDHGTELGGRYALDGRIASGGMGEVWSARDQRLDRDVAVKVLKEEFSDDPLFRARFHAEAHNAAALSHPGIAAVFDYGEQDSSPYIVMELVRGEPLSHLLATRGPWPVRRALGFIADIADALHAAHRSGVVHRDVKPSNLLVTPEGRVKVTDFGIARATGAVPLTVTGQVVGTACYMSPEQASGRAATPASDIYALGVVAYEVLVGRPPFAADSAVALAIAQVRDLPPPMASEVPDSVRDLIARSLAKDPEQRPADAGLFAAELRRLADDLPSDTPSENRGGLVQNETTRLPHSSTLPMVMALGARPRARRGRQPGWLLAVATGIALAVVGTRLNGIPSVATGPTSVSATVESSPAVATSAAAATTVPSTPPTTSSDPSPAVSTAPAGVVVDEGAFLGRKASDVRKELELLGLVVEEEKVAGTDDAERNTVVGIRPEGELVVGTTVVLLVASGKDEDD